MSVLASLFGKETLIGLDIGSANIKAIMAESQRDNFRITRAAQQKTPPGAVRDGIVVDRDAVAGAIRQMMKAANMSASSAVMAVAGTTVQVRQIKIPRMTEAALAKSARYEAAKYITSNIEDSSLAFEILGAAPDEPSQMDVMLVAAPREMVESRIAAAERAGLDAISIDLEAFALQRALIDTNRRDYDDGLRALVDIGAAHTEVSLLLGTSFALTRSVPIAGDTFTDALKNYLRVDASEAERRKTEVDLGVLLQGGGDPEAVEAARSVQTVLDELLREIRRSVNYFQSQLADGSEQRPLSEIILAGGSAQMGGLASYVSARLTVEARLANPFASSAYDAAPEATAWLQEQAPRLGTALGLAIKDYMHSPVSAKG